MKDYDVKVYRGWPETSGDTLAEMIEKGHLKPLDGIEEAGGKLCKGVYSCHITGEGIYPTLKVIYVREYLNRVELKRLLDDCIVPIQYSEGRAEGYQPTVVAPDPPEYFRRTQKDEMLCIWPDEILDIFADTVVPVHHQCRKQEELEKALMELDAQIPQMKIFDFGISEHYGFTIPMVILTTSPLSGCDCWEEAMGVLKKEEKINIWYQAQVHGNEPAACDGALAVLESFYQDEALRNLLDCINLVIIPRVNPEAAYLYRRMAYDNIDLNRDHMACEAYETRLLHRAFLILEPEVVLDGHEFTFFAAGSASETGFVDKGCEIMSSPATSLNIDEAVRECSYRVCGRVFSELQEKGCQVDHFGTAEKSSFGRGFYGLSQCLSFLIETRGIGGGRYGYDKRVAAQRETVLSYLKNVTALNTDVKKTVREARRKNFNDVEIVLQHGSSERAFTPYSGVNVQYCLDGSLYQKTEEPLQLNDLPLRRRKAVKGYILPADVKHIEDILRKVKELGCRADYLEPGCCLMAEQYRCMGLREKDAHETDIVAELMAAKNVVFHQGAYLISADDFRMVLLAMLMEPDVTDMTGTKGSLFQQGRLDFEEGTGMFPLYRITNL